MGMTTSPEITCPTQHLHGDTHALFCHYGHKWCPCEMEAIKANCDHTASAREVKAGLWECLVCGVMFAHEWVE